MTEGSTVANTGRVHIIDAIRGLAILGILFANIHSWSGYKFISLADIETLPLFQYDALFMHLHYWLVDGKFYAIFSMLFGAGFGLQYIKNQQNQPPFLKKYRRRLGFLLLFGVLHALLWSGDILTLYALLAFVLVQLRNTPLDKLLPLAVCLLAFFALSQFVHIWFTDSPILTQPLAHKTYSDMAPQVLTDAFGRGGWSQVFAVNLHNLYWRWLDFFPNGRISRILGLFVLGFYLARAGYFLTAIYSGKRLLLYLLIGIVATAAARITGTNISSWATDGADVCMKLVLVAGQLFLALAYMSLLAQVFRSSYGETILYPLTLVGRMAFTSYLLQTVIGIGIFYGVGFGQWGTLGLVQLWLLALLIFSVQVICCSLWLRCYRQGPVEWLWACLTAKKFRSNRLVHA